MVKYQHIKLQATVENFRSDKARTASVVNDFKNDHITLVEELIGRRREKLGESTGTLEMFQGTCALEIFNAHLDFEVRSNTRLRTLPAFPIPQA